MIVIMKYDQMWTIKKSLFKIRTITTIIYKPTQTSTVAWIYNESRNSCLYALDYENGIPTYSECINLDDYKWIITKKKGYYFKSKSNSEFKYYNDRCAVTKRPVTLYDCREEAYDDQIKIIITTRTTTTTTATSKSNFTSNNFNNKLYSKGECYSYYGYCGIGCNYCSIGYQPDYGRCNNGSLFNMAIVTSRMFIEDQNVKVNLDYAMALTINVVNNIVDVIL
ncbi:hypothetical protein H8356DRAFT_1408960 [Neocallimastix lanati (nom. inval.)]|nr:hypothetical protein H8356DRAFT_1408960 [Neocallimastix sp. JGI-2020a]